MSQELLRSLSIKTNQNGNYCDDISTWGFPEFNEYDINDDILDLSNIVISPNLFEEVKEYMIKLNKSTNVTLGLYSKEGKQDIVKFNYHGVYLELDQNGYHLTKQIPLKEVGIGKFCYSTCKGLSSAYKVPYQIYRTKLAPVLQKIYIFQKLEILKNPNRLNYVIAKLEQLGIKYD